MLRIVAILISLFIQTQQVIKSALSVIFDRFADNRL